MEKIAAPLVILWSLAAFAEEGAVDANAPPPPPPPPAPPASPLLQGWSIGGWIEAAYAWNTNQPQNVTAAARTEKENGLRIFDVYNNEFTLHQVSLAVEKAATDESWIGMKVVALAGQDAKWLHSAGLFDGGTGAASGDGEDFDLLDAFITLKIPSKFMPLPTVFKVGKFETIHGVEIAAAPGNLNYSRSFLFGYAVPIAHTGAMMDMGLFRRPGTEDEMLGIGTGIVNGWDNVKDNNQSKSFMEQVRFKPCDEFETHAELITGPEQDDNDSNWRTLIDIIATVNGWGPLKELSVTGNYDLAYEEDAAAIGGPDVGHTKWYGFAGYIKYQLAKIPFLEKWHVGFRGEWFRDPEGVRIANLPAVGSDGADLYELTWTIGWRPLDGLLVRGEYRYDKADRNLFANEHGTGEENHQNTFAIDLVFTY